MPDDILGTETIKAPVLDATKNPALRGVSTEAHRAGVTGQHHGEGAGVIGKSEHGVGVIGKSDNGAGVYGEGATNGLHGESNKPNHSGVWANNSGGGMGVAGTSDALGGIGVYGRGEAFAGKFEGTLGISGQISLIGDMQVSGDIHLVNADCAEDFDIADLEIIEPGTVMVIDLDGALKASSCAYDKRVAGVVSGAGLYKPALILDKQESLKSRLPIALMGKVYCKVDATFGAIEVGDLLTTSPEPGHAMKVSDHSKAFGAVIGKALAPLTTGQHMIPILVALQ